MFFGYSNDPSSAFVAFDKDMIIQCCDNYSAAREARIAKDIDRAVQREMTDSRSWFGRVILRKRGPAATREEAIERSKEDPNQFLEYSEWFNIHDRGYRTAELVGKIRMMAVNSSTPHVVLSDEGQFILNYKEAK